MNNLEQSYEKILDVLREFSVDNLLSHQRRKPKLSDLELISLNLTAEYKGIDSENDLFRQLPKSLHGRIERSVYNRRKRRLLPHIRQIQQQLAERFNEFEDYFLIDSMPLEICKMARIRRVKVCTDNIHALPDKGYCAAQDCDYYGYKLHAVCSTKGVFHSFDLSPASVHDIHYLKDIKEQLSNCVLIGDKGYLSAEIQLNLFESCRINLATPMRKNQHQYKAQPRVFRKARKRIETLFSQLCDQFMVRRNYAKTFIGFCTRIVSKISALTIVQFINKFIFNRNINNIKINIV